VPQLLKDVAEGRPLIPQIPVNDCGLMPSCRATTAARDSRRSTACRRYLRLPAVRTATLQVALVTRWEPGAQLTRDSRSETHPAERLAASAVGQYQSVAVNVVGLALRSDKKLVDEATKGAQIHS